MASEPNSLDVVRTAVEGLSDKQVRHLVATVVTRLVPTVIDSIVETIAAHGQAPWDDGRGHASSSSQDAVRKVCEVCGRQGTRQYVQTPTGWRCSAPVKCRERHRPHREPERPPAATPSAVAMLREITPPTDAPSDDSAYQLPASPRRAGEPLVTARCQDCSRVWTITGSELVRSVGTHEQARGHVVDVLETTEVEAHSGT